VIDPVVQPSPQRRPSPWQGCRRNWPVVAALALLLPAFLCGLTLVIYLLFPPPPLNVLVLGVDGRGREGYQSRADSIMLVGVSPARLKVSLLSIPRDLFMEVPGYGSQRINTVNFLGEQAAPGGGPRLMAETLEHNFGVRPDRYVRLSFQTFVAVVDAVGGITIDVERNLTDTAFPTEDGGVMTVQFESGRQFMDGERALIYARMRNPDDDYRRAGRQQQVVSAVLARLADPVSWPRVLQALGEGVDTDLNLVDAVRLLPPAVLNLGRFEQLVIDRDYILGTAAGHAVPNYERIRPWLEGRFD